MHAKIYFCYCFKCSSFGDDSHRFWITISMVIITMCSNYFCHFGNDTYWTILHAKGMWNTWSMWTKLYLTIWGIACTILSKSGYVVIISMKQCDNWSYFDSLYFARQSNTHGSHWFWYKRTRMIFNKLLTLPSTFGEF